MMRGTTPIISYTFHTIDVEDIAVIYLTLQQGGVKVERDITTATVETSQTVGKISWKLTQEETLKFLQSKALVQIQIRYRLVDGTAGGSKISQVDPQAILKDGVI